MSSYLQRLIRPPSRGVAHPVPSATPSASEEPVDESAFGLETMEAASGDANATRAAERDNANAPRDASDSMEPAPPRGTTFDDVVRWVESPVQTPKSPAAPDASTRAAEPFQSSDAVVDVSPAAADTRQASRERETHATAARVEPKQQVGAKRGNSIRRLASERIDGNQARAHVPYVEIRAMGDTPVPAPSPNAEDLHRQDTTSNPRSTRPIAAPGLFATHAVAPAATHAPSQRAVEVRIGSISLIVKNAQPRPQTPSAPLVAPVAAATAAAHETGPSADWRFSPSRHYLRRS